MKKSLAAAILAVATGCTMCPDPYDYSGPVPNGSAPQNDFRARSNGIIPIGMLPKPWPRIVDREADQPADAESSNEQAVRVPDLVARALADDMGPEDDASIAVARVSAEESAEDVETSEHEAGSETDPVVVPEVDLEPIEPEDQLESQVEEEEPTTDAAEPEAETPADILPPPAPSSTIPVGPVPRETPGWRPRSQP
jgi:hypothetical protein